MVVSGVSKLAALLVLLHTTSTSATTSTSIVDQSANGLQISLGNRENSSTGFSDNGTNISNVEVNYARILPSPAQFFSNSNRQESSDGDESRTLPFGMFAPGEWIETILESYIRTANETRRHKLGAFSQQFVELESYAEDVAVMLDRIRIAFGIELNQNLLTLDVNVLRCAQGETLDTIAGKVFAGDRDCIKDRLERVRNAQWDAVRNISRELIEWDEEYLRNQISLCSGSDPSSDETNDSSTSYSEHELACISGVSITSEKQYATQMYIKSNLTSFQILHQVHLKTLLMSHTARQLTAEASDIFGTAKADLLQCAGDLVELAGKSLQDIANITSQCQHSLSAQQNEVQ
uniref:Uncharacterized protein n=1 Tax=Anopheles farauti TaxID=69004 RepID=A0A1Y9H9L4_9DIPT